MGANTLPSRFSIDDLDPFDGGPGRTAFGGTLFQGLLERGGSEIASGVSFEVEQVVHFRRFQPAAEETDRETLRYVCFGQADAAFLAHVITTPPDFDQILGIDIGSLNGVSDEELRAGVIIRVAERSNDVQARLKEGETVSGEVQREPSRNAASIELTVASEIYLETDDLAEAV